MAEARHLDGSPISDDEWCHGETCGIPGQPGRHLHGKPTVIPKA